MRFENQMLNLLFTITMQVKANLLIPQVVEIEKGLQPNPNLKNQYIRVIRQKKSILLCKKNGLVLCSALSCLNSRQKKFFKYR